MDKFNPKTVKVSVRNEDISIGVFKVKHIKKVSKHVGVVQSLFGKKGITPDDYMNAADCIGELLETVTGKEKDFIDDLSIDEAVELFNAVVEVNADSFLSKILPKFTEMVEKLNKKAAQVQKKTGQTVSKS